LHKCPDHAKNVHATPPYYKGLCSVSAHSCVHACVRDRISSQLVTQNGWCARARGRFIQVFLGDSLQSEPMAFAGQWYVLSRAAAESWAAAEAPPVWTPDRDAPGYLRRDYTAVCA
jgi:hypothetical protein